MSNLNGLTANRIEIKDTSNWSGVLGMSVCAFAMVAAEFLPVSLLTPMARDLSVSQGAIGQGISISGLFALITALTVATFTQKMNKRVVLLSLVFIMFISGIFVGYAHNYTLYMIGRALIGVALAGFWSLSASAAIHLVQTKDVSKALAIINGGAALSMVVAAPLGSWLGEIIGWRNTFLGLAPVSIIAFVWLYTVLPSMPGKTESKSYFSVFKPLSSAFVTSGFIAVTFLFAAQFTLFTYIRPFLEIKTQVSAEMLSMILLWIGITGFVGTAIISRFLTHHLLYRTLATAPIVLAVCTMALLLLGHQLIPTIIIFGIWGLIASSAPVGWWTWVSQKIEDTDAGGGIMVAVCQLAIGLGSSMGGFIFEGYGLTATLITSLSLFLCCALACYSCYALDREKALSQ
ncbi:MAG TPA: MFS transporter [Gammaproteobacteria bacterium]|nr:MFS transporter [Gammaproteobacteria bacterium]HBF09428.1 MFS transporter [Gammaproteobacteria bacterium]HCK92814.1 MFS transporter [Gammaproteobacteria bacterium]|tara:strand:+ start:11932 stop:13143 length:1212 start_codon:yes stop_codon:yes gene_type:complete